MRTRIALAAILLAGCGSSASHRSTVTTTTLMVAGAIMPPLPISYVPDYDIGQPAHVAAPRARRSLPRPRPTPNTSTLAAPEPVKPQPGLNWAALRQCESGGNYGNKNNRRYRGAYQFSYATWASVGGSGDPADAPPDEQDQRAQVLLARSGRRQWPVCGRHL